jgi:tRNA(Ile)-lysidine synthase TilS/MesJ
VRPAVPAVVFGHHLDASMACLLLRALRVSGFCPHSR